jgi:hypothetical protein
MDTEQELTLESISNKTISSISRSELNENIVAAGNYSNAKRIWDKV